MCLIQRKGFKPAIGSEYTKGINKNLGHENVWKKKQFVQIHHRCITKFLYRSTVD